MCWITIGLIQDIFMQARQHVAYTMKESPTSKLNALRLYTVNMFSTSKGELPRFTSSAS